MLLISSFVPFHGFHPPTASQKHAQMVSYFKIKMFSLTPQNILICYLLSQFVGKRAYKVASPLTYVLTILSFYGFLTFLCICDTCMCVCSCVCTWKPEADTGYLPLLFSTLIFETVVTEPDTLQFS